MCRPDKLPKHLPGPLFWLLRYLREKKRDWQQALLQSSRQLLGQ
jgi:hypothetical protein